jgi:Tol biopolymer transport system component
MGRLAALPGVFVALVSLACGLGGGDPAARGTHLGEGDVILLFARQGDRAAVYAVTRGQTVPTPWQSLESDSLEQVTSVSYGYMAHKALYPSVADAYYGIDGYHYLIPAETGDEAPAEKFPHPEDESLLGELSPDGRKIVWLAPNRGPVSWADASGGAPQIILEGGNYIQFMGWSPDGSLLAIQDYRAPDTLRLYIADTQSGNVHDVYKTNRSWIASGFAMTWSPDGSQLAFLQTVNCKASFDLAYGTRHTCNYDLFILSVEGGAPKRITDTTESGLWLENDYTLAWLTGE